MEIMSLKNIKLEKPLFYANEFALRFEIGPNEEEIWDEEQSSFNESYFSIALDRALKVFKTVMMYQLLIKYFQTVAEKLKSKIFCLNK